MGRRNDPSGLQEIIESIRKDPKFGKQFEFAKVWRHWPEVTGEELAPYGQPLGVRDDTLIVEVETSVWMHKYAAAKWRILNHVNGLVKGDLIREMFLVLSEDVREAGGIEAPQDDVE
jgi:hypothetical protein